MHPIEQRLRSLIDGFKENYWDGDEDDWTLKQFEIVARDVHVLIYNWGLVQAEDRDNNVLEAEVDSMRRKIEEINNILRRNE